MNLVEYEKVKNLTYLEYCDYLQQKYGIGLSDFMTKSWNKTQKLHVQKMDYWRITNMKTTLLCYRQRNLQCKILLSGN